jgi:uncharacterized protein HemX
VPDRSTNAPSPSDDSTGATAAAAGSTTGGTTGGDTHTADTGKSGGLSNGAIAGIVIVLVVVGVMIGLAAVYWKKRREFRMRAESRHAQSEMGDGHFNQL